MEIGPNFSAFYYSVRVVVVYFNVHVVLLFSSFIYCSYLCLWFVAFIDLMCMLLISLVNLVVLCVFKFMRFCKEDQFIFELNLHVYENIVWLVWLETVPFPQYFDISHLSTERAIRVQLACSVSAASPEWLSKLWWWQGYFTIGQTQWWQW